MNKEQLKDVFQLFVSKSDIRGHLLTPFYNNQYSFATDGHVLIAYKEDLGFEHRDKPNAKAAIPNEHLWKGYAKLNAVGLKDELDKLPSEPLYDEIPCDKCDEGYFEYKGKEYECQHCDGNGFTDGIKIGEHKSRYQYFSIDINSTINFFSAFLLEKISNASKMLEIETWDIVYFDKLKPMVLTSEEIIVLIMPTTSCDNPMSLNHILSA